MTRAVIEIVKWPIVEVTKDGRANVGFDVLEGTQEDAGFFLLVYNGEGYKSGASSANAGIFTLNISLPRLKHYVLNDHPPQNHELELVEFTCDENERTVLIQVPDWLRYNPLSVPQEEKVKEPEVAPPSHDVSVAKREAVDDRPLHVTTKRSNGAEVVVASSGNSTNRQQRRVIASKVAHSLR
jgi:hypothetical protein